MTLKPDVSNDHYDCYFIENRWRVIPKLGEVKGYLAGPTNRIVIKADPNKALTPH